MKAVYIRRFFDRALNVLLRPVLLCLTWLFIGLALIFMCTYKRTGWYYALLVWAGLATSAYAISSIRGLETDNSRGWAAYLVGYFWIKLSAHSDDEKGHLLQAAKFLNDAGVAISPIRFPRTFAASWALMAVALVSASGFGKKDLVLQETAIDAIRHSLAVWSAIREPRNWSRVQMLLATCYERIQDHDAARRVLREVIFGTNPNRLFRIWIIANLNLVSSLLNFKGENNRSSDGQDEARRILNQLLTFPSRFQIPSQAIWARARHATLYSELYAQSMKKEDLQKAEELIAELEGVIDDEVTPRDRATVAQTSASISLVRGLLNDDLPSMNSGIDKINALTEEEINAEGLLKNLSRDTALGLGFLMRSITTESELDAAKAVKLLNQSAQSQQDINQHLSASPTKNLMTTALNIKDLSGFQSRRHRNKPHDIAQDFLDRAETALEYGDNDNCAELLLKTTEILEQSDSSSTQPSEIRAHVNLYGHLHALKARTMDSEEEYERAVFLLQEALGGATYSDAPVFWVNNRLVLVKTLIHWDQRGGTQKNLERILGLLSQLLEHVTWEKRPHTWLRVSQTRCMYICQILTQEASEIDRSTVSDAIGSAILEGQELLANAHILVCSAETTSERHQILTSIAGVGDELAILAITIGRPDVALKAVSFSRSILTQRTFVEDGLPEAVSGKVRAARLAWRNCIEREERLAREILTAASGVDGPMQSSRASDILGNDSEKLLRDYMTLVSDHDLDAILAPDLEDLTGSIPDGTAVAIIVTGSETSVMICLHRGTTQLDEKNVLRLNGLNSNIAGQLLHGNEGWFEAYERFRNSVSNENATEEELTDEIASWSERLDEVSTFLGKTIAPKLITFLDQNLPAGRVPEVRFVAGGHLSTLPLHAASWRDDTNQKRYLIERAAVSYWPNLQSIATGTPRPTSCTSDTETGERVSVMKVLGVPSGDIDLPIDARLSTSLESTMAGLESCTYSYFYCHGSFNELEPDSSGIELPDRTVLSRSHLTALDLNASRMVFLGACESSMIMTRRLADEFIGMPVGLMDAGVSSVCASLWLTHASVAQKIAQRVFDLQLEEGELPAYALRQATLEIAGLLDQASDTRSTESQYSDPVFWSCFNVTGGC